MPERTLNLGILAHIDAGKTSLSERLLFDHGVLARLGSVDGGDTATDTSELERERGITIRSAVASFGLGGSRVNLVDTPGHPDFIAEVERALSVLDGAVLVVSSVEGVQAQTRVLMRSLKRMSLPTLLFVNKVDRTGARYGSVLDELRRKLGLPIVPMVRVDELGTREATVQALSLKDGDHRAQVVESLAECDDTLLAHFVEGVIPSAGNVRRRLVRLTSAGLVHPVFFGSAISGAGVAELSDGIAELLPAAPSRSADDPSSGTVFAIERTEKGDKVAYARMFSGTLREREHIAIHRLDGKALNEHSERISRIAVVGSSIGGSSIAGSPGGGSPGGVLRAGSIGKLSGLRDVRVGDWLGEPGDVARQAHFSPPILESAVRAVHSGENLALRAALNVLASEDPLIRTRPAPGGGTSVLLYGAVQREVIAERLDREFGIKAVFEEMQPVYFERPAGAGAALYEFNPRGGNAFWQSVGIRVEPREMGTGNAFFIEAERGALPKAYYRAIEESALRTLSRGPRGWEMADCALILTKVDFDAPKTVAAHFRNLTHLVVARALRAARTTVYEPSYDIDVELPADTVSAVVKRIAALGADITGSEDARNGWRLTGNIPARLLHEIGSALPSLTRGEGMLWHEPGTDRVVRGARR